MPTADISFLFNHFVYADMTEPAYKEQEFVTPTKARRILVRQWFEGKYRNM